MTDHDFTEHLRKTEERIAEALRRIGEQEAMMRSRRMGADERERAAALLRSLQRSLEVFRSHRDTVVQFIAVTKKKR